MEQSGLLMSAQIHFVDAQLSLIHIPLRHYQKYLSTILQLLFPSTGPSNGHSKPHEGAPWANAHAFLNVSVTPIEASIVCSRDLAEELFAPKIAQEKKGGSTDGTYASISKESYVVISVEGGGTEAGQRVLELTGPLALAGISLFFVTTYFSDYILVPTKARTTVVRALEDRGFAFQKSSSTYVNPSTHQRNASSTSSLSTMASPKTPPPTTISELQARTFALLNKRSIVPRVDRDLRLIQCAGRRGNPQSTDADELGLQLGLTKCLIHQPRFLSLTLTEDESASILMEKRLLANFDVGTDKDNVLLGSKDELLIPITLDLEPLPFEATGIVCGIAGRLVGGHSVMQAIEMSYLSTAKAGTVMVAEENLELAMMALRVGENGAIEP